MVASLKKEWNALQRGRPGHRFQARYEASRRKEGGSFIGRIVRLVVALLAVTVGIVLVFIPGPAILFFLIAGSLLAVESRHVARFLDWAEVRIRKVVTWLAVRWRKLPVAGKVVVVLVVAAAGAGALFVAYRLFWG